MAKPIRYGKRIQTGLIGIPMASTFENPLLIGCLHMATLSFNLPCENLLCTVFGVTDRQASRHKG